MEGSVPRGFPGKRPCSSEGLLTWKSTLISFHNYTGVVLLSTVKSGALFTPKHDPVAGLRATPQERQGSPDFSVLDRKVLAISC